MIYLDYSAIAVDSFKTMRILLIEDEQKLALSLKKALESERFAVDTCFDGQEGYVQAVVESYDAIILDLTLPSLDGLTIAQKLREEGCHTPILMLTARDNVAYKIEGLTKGADDYVVKPFHFEELVARLHSLIRRSSPNQATVLEVGTLKLDPFAKEVTRSGKKIALSAKEYTLLEFLIRHVNHVVTKTQIIEHVWDSELDPFSNVVDVYIGYVRSKIDKAFPKEKQLLKTLKGLGYKLSYE